MQLKKNTGEGPDVCGFCRRLIVNTLGSHVLRRTDKVLVGRPHIISRSELPSQVWVGQIVRRAEVDELDSLAFGEEHIFWLQVPVDDLSCVQFLDLDANLLEHMPGQGALQKAECSALRPNFILTFQHLGQKEKLEIVLESSDELDHR